MKLEIGQSLLYKNNGQPALPAVVISIQDVGTASVGVFMPTGYSYRSAVKVYQPEEWVVYPDGEYCYWSEESIAREKRYPTNPDLWG